ncbi:MAG: NADH-quinone oxidoreductase subunit J [Deltaproteobacteria bacterium]|nr:NADH-quinone oxidoreductase subunit J [Deltaproteobacteria bacterium]
MAIGFFIMALLIIASAIGVVAAKNPIHSALCLVANLLTVAAIFASLDAHFLATVQIIVYAGAIVVLVVFVLMLLNLKVEQPRKVGIPTYVAATITGLLFLAIALPPLNEAFKVFPEPTAGLSGSVQNIGKILYTQYAFPFEAASMLLMAAIIGAVMLAKKRNPKAQQETRS